MLLPFSDPRASRLELAGGKGCSLSRLVQQGFPVPDGAIVSADAYRAFAADAAEVVAALRDVGPGDVERIARESRRIRATLAARPLPASLAVALRRWLAARPAGAWAVRSSGTLEDLAGAAFAGQHDTFLNCLGAEEVADRIRDCWLSLWHERAIAYRARLGFDHATVAMAVVVQRMVPADAAGVAFSVDPVSGAFDRVVVDANFGLGESVVSGDAEPDHFVVDRTTLAPVERRIARKTMRVVAAAAGANGTIAAQLEPEDADRAALTDDEAVRVAELALAVERRAGWPQDIEWALHDGELWLLQARPITAVAPRWTRDESAERFPSVVTPLTWEMVEAGFHRSLNHSFRLMGLPPFSGKWFALFDHYVYGNQTAVELYARRAPFAVASLAELEAALPALLERFAWLRALPDEWQAGLPAYLAQVDMLLAEPLVARSLRGLWDYVERVNDVGTRYFLPNIAISIGHGLLHRAVEALAALAAGPQEAGALATRLLACETRTAQVNAELRRLAALAGADAVFARTLRATPSRALIAGYDRSAHAFWSAFDAFVQAHGHRENEFDAYHPTWLEAPWTVLDHVRALLDAPDPRDGAPDATAAERELAALLPASVREIALGVVRLARAYVQLDDLEHYHTTRLALPLRRGLRALGERLVAMGIVDDAMDVFFAHRDQLADAIAAADPARWRALGAAIRREKAEYLEDRACTPDWVLGASAEPPTASGDSLSGIAGSPGTAEGNVHLVHSAEDFASFPRGAVLVARTTNPAWTPLFHSASAVVTESGGPLSHGAVTAREMGIPAVMAVRGVLGILRNGDRVRVHGGGGTVEILERRLHT